MISWLKSIWESVKPDQEFWEDYADWLDEFLNMR